MINKILVAGFACLSVVAVAQSSGNTSQASGNADQTANTKQAAPRDAASGQSSGKRMHEAVAVQKDQGTQGQASGQSASKGSKSGADDWQASGVKKEDSKGAQGQNRVATGDVNGDGKADLTATKNSGHATEKNAAMNTSSNSQSSSDTATGQTSGKRQHKPMTVRKEVDATSPLLAK